VIWSKEQQQQQDQLDFLQTENWGLRTNYSHVWTSPRKGVEAGANIMNIMNYYEFLISNSCEEPSSCVKVPP
jgi:hypothetical protein